MTRTRRAGPWTALLLTMTTLLAACGSVANGSPVADEASAAPPTPTECETLGYPCSLADVAPATLEQSMSLATDARDRIDDGADTAAVAAWLDSQPAVAVVEHDDNGLRFRLDGGRFFWINADTIEGRTSSSSRQAAVRDPFAPAGSFGRGTVFAPAEPGFFSRRPLPEAVGEPALDGVVGSGDDKKSAIVVAPMVTGDLANYDAKDVASILGGTRGYEGRVTYVEGGPTSQAAPLQAFGQLADHDVVFVRSSAMQICDPAPCHAVIAASRMLGDHLTVAPEARGAVDIIAGASGLWFYGFSADSFRKMYPNGLQRAMIFFDVPNLDDPAMTAAIKGPSSEYYHWDGARQPAATRDAIGDFVSDLARTGRSGGVVYDERRLELLSDGSTFVREKPGNQGGQRIRELMTFRNPLTKDELVTGSNLQIEGSLGDGKPDKVRVLVDIEGIPESESGQTVVTLSVDGEDAPALVPADGGEIIDDVTWRLEAVAEVPDLTEGQQIDILAEALLAEGGKSQHDVVVTVGQELGTKLVGDFTATSNTIWPGVTMTATAHVTWVRKPSDPGDTKFTYEPVDGTYSWRIEGTSDKGCQHAAGPLIWPIEVDNGDELRIDLSRKAEGIITYWGDGHVGDGPEVDLTIDCPETGDANTRTRAEGDWFQAPRDAGFTFGGGALTGSWRSDSRIATTYTWTITPAK